MTITPGLVYEPGRRRYVRQDTGEVLDRVTRLVGRVMPFDRDEVAARVAERRGIEVADVLAEWQATQDRGTLAHQYAMLKAKGADIPHPAGVTDLCIGVDAFMKDRGLSLDNIEHVEEPMADLSRGIAGTADLIATLDGVRWLYDYKTAARMSYKGWDDAMALEPVAHLDNSKWHKHALQLAMYRLILEVNSVPVDRAAVVWLTGGHYEIQEPAFLRAEAEAVMATIEKGAALDALDTDPWEPLTVAEVAE